jgi:protein-tyrosine-phosphatase
MAPPDSKTDVPARILFVCSGNTCRSPLAEVLARHLARELGVDSVEVRSAGTSTVAGLPASGGALRAARRHGLSLEDHESTPLGSELVEWADHIFTMGSTHLHTVREMGGTGKSALLGAYARGGTPAENDLSVPDPFGGDDEIYEETYQTLVIYVGLILNRLISEDSR